MKNNIFLTGKMNSGKTTIIKKVINKLDLSTGGFMVGRDQQGLNWSSFYLLPAAVYLENKQKKIKKFKEKGTFAWKDKEGKIKIDAEVFDNYGVKLLNGGLNKDLIIMDELGRFELEAYNFQNKVLKFLKSNMFVLGVIKKEKNSFLNKVRDLLDNKPIIVREDNRDEVYNFVLKELKNKVEEQK